jgi:hypothetical protein
MAHRKQPELTLLSVVDAEARHIVLSEGAVSLSSFAWFVR